MRIPNPVQIKMLFKKPKDSKISDMIIKGSERLNEDLNLVSIVKKLRQLDIILQNSLLKDEKRKHLVDHAR
jgi:hypothetical protein